VSWRAGIVVALASSACSQVFGLATPIVIDGPPPDRPIDVPTDIYTCTPVNLSCLDATVAFMCAGECWVGCRQTGLTWLQAGQRCSLWGGALARFGSSSEQDCALAMFAPQGPTWIGLSQKPGQLIPKDGWIWEHDIPLTFVRWGPAEPDDADGSESDHQEQCAVMDANGAWSDVDCGGGSGAPGFMCRRP